MGHSQVLRNDLGFYLNLSLAVTGFLTLVIAAIAATNIFGENSKLKAIIALVLALVVAANTGAGGFLKNESERFYKENKHKYADLSEEMNVIIKDFYIEFEKADYNDKNIVEKEKRDQLLTLTSDKLKKISEIKLAYSEKYKINVNPIVK